MPTDLPKKIPQNDPLGADRKAIRKLALKSMRRSLWQITGGLLLHYSVTLAAVAVIAYSGFSDVPRAALSATAVGLLARWFLPNQARTKAAQQQSFQGAQVVDLTPEQLSEFLGKLGQPDAHQDATPSGVAKTSPYL